MTLQAFSHRWWQIAVERFTCHLAVKWSKCCPRWSEKTHDPVVCRRLAQLVRHYWLPPTERQVAYFERLRRLLGLPPVSLDNLERRTVSQLIDEMQRSRSVFANEQCRRKFIKYLTELTDSSTPIQPLAKE